MNDMELLLKQRKEAYDKYSSALTVAIMQKDSCNLAQLDKLYKDFVVLDKLVKRRQR